MSDVTRKQQLKAWLSSLFLNQNIILTALTGDAGFRVYYRFSVLNKCYIVVDSDPSKVNNLSFVSLAKQFKQQHILVPEVVHYHQELGFMCLTDFGDDLLSEQLTEQSMAKWYSQAISLLDNIGDVFANKDWPLPEYDAPFLQLEMDIFSRWLIKEHLQISLTKQEQMALQHCFEQLIKSALEQPQVTVHRDYHSRNIMVTENNQLAIIDFQDAVTGPITYDVVSLLRDCYVRWDDQLIYPLLLQYHQHLKQQGKIAVDFQQFQRWFDLMGLQRHIKASGIFARLYHRDAKSSYLKDIPLTLNYIVDIASKYSELSTLSELVKHKVLPAVLSREKL